MKTTTLKKRIRQEASQVNIPDVSLNIISKLEKLEKPYIVETAKPNNRHFRLAMTLSISALLILFLSFGYIQLNQTDPISDDTIIEAVVLSSMTSTSISTSYLSYDDETILLAYGDHDDDTTIFENETTHLAKYLNVLENLLATSNQYRFYKERISAIKNQYIANFETTNLANETSTYTLSYKVNKINDGIYQLKGSITSNEETFQIEITYNILTKSILTKTYQNENEYVMVSYEQVNQTYVYAISHYINDQVEESAEISFDDLTEINLNFMSGAASGAYQFQIGMNENNEKFLSIQYQVNRRQGQIEITLSEDKKMYYITVTPQNGQSFVITKTRGQKQNS